MNKLKRLQALLAKKADELTDEESTELKKLQEWADGKGIDPKTGEFKDDDGDDDDNEHLDAKSVEKMMNGAAGNAITVKLDEIGLDADIIKGIKDNLGKESELTEEKVKSIVEAANTGSVDQAKIIEEVTKAINENRQEGISADDLKSAFSGAVQDLAKQQQKFLKDHADSQKKIQFPADPDYPVTHRSGNLSVAAAQLKNLCMMKVSDEAIEGSDGGRGIKRPTHMNDGITDDMLANAKRVGGNHLSRLRKSMRLGGKAITTSGSGNGAELIETDLSSDLMTRFYLSSQIAAEFMASEIDMPTKVFQIPLRTTRTAFYVGSENPGSDPTASNPGTSQITLTAQKLIGRAVYSYEADEDAVIAILPFLQADMGEGAADAFEGALINGDTTATHQDSDIHAVTGHHAKLWKGLRKLAIAGSLHTSFASGGISAANLKTIRKTMDKWGINPSELLIIAGPKGYNDLVGLDETLTAEKVGSNMARILTGEAPSVFGIRIVTSSQCREVLNASGVYDGTTTDKGSILLVHRPSFFVGVRRGFTVEVDRNISEQTNTVVASFRRDFQPKEAPSASIPLVTMGYNYTA